MARPFQPAAGTCLPAGRCADLAASAPSKIPRRRTPPNFKTGSYIIDCLPNMGPADVSVKCVPLVKQLRAAHPETPIVLVEDRRFTNDWITPAKRQFHTENHAALRAAYEALLKEGVRNLHYIPGDKLYGDDTEGATDASHASDLGFMRQAEIFEGVLRRALPK